MNRWVILVAMASACASGRIGDNSGGGGGNNNGPVDASSGDAPNGSIDAAPDSGGGGGGGGLDPDLELPDPNGRVCDEPRRQGGTECPPLEVCRFFTPTEGRCEACGTYPDCGLVDEPCSASRECDILFSCYQGHCVSFCSLGGLECGPPADCIDIGHATLGVCRPT
jgi:hypothetical protein